MSEPDTYALKANAEIAAPKPPLRPLNAARGDLEALALDFAALASTRRNMPVAPGSVRSLGEARS